MGKKTGCLRSLLEQRFWLKVDIRGPDECWEWQGACARGYGRVIATAPSRRLLYAHRVAWELAYGPIPEGMLVCHHCDNKGCCNPSHLFVGTQSDNMRDAFTKGRLHVPDSVGEKNTNSKLTNRQAVEIRKENATGRYTQVELGVIYGVSQQTISRIVNRKLWKHV